MITNAKIGLEIHCELLTKTKMFCSCKNEFGKEQNTNVCPVCLGHPGTLPQVNKQAVELGVKAGLIFDCKINNLSAFDRKNYFYPDLPKAYQITQQRMPICKNGSITLKNGNVIHIHDIHLEEDAGKLIHKDGKTIIDYNRAGVPLIEIVTEPDITTPHDAMEVAREIAERMHFSEISDCKMQESSMRVDVNVSIPHSPTRVEIKNIGSIKAIGRAIEYEIQRQSEIVARGDFPVAQTRRYDEDKGITASMRSKETANDYRYFPEPNIPAIYISPEEIEAIKESIPVMPRERYARYITLGISPDDATVLSNRKDFSDYFEKALLKCKSPVTLAKLMLGEVSRIMNTDALRISAEMVAEISDMLYSGQLSDNSAKELIKAINSRGGTPSEVAKELNLIMSNDTEEITKKIELILSQNKDLVTQYNHGNEKVLSFIMGMAVRSCGKSASPTLVRKILQEKLREA